MWYFYRLRGGYIPGISCCWGYRPAWGCYGGVTWDEYPTNEYNVGEATIKGGSYQEEDWKVGKDHLRCAPNKLQVISILKWANY